MAPITRTCNALILCFGLAAASAAAARPAVSSALSSYVEARMAEAEGDDLSALAAYKAALKAEPNNEVIAVSAFRHAVEAGDRRLALRAAEALEALGQLPEDGALLLIGVRLQKGDAAGATQLADRLKGDKQLSLLLPFIRSWIGLAAGDLSAPSLIGASGNAALGANLTTEQRALADLMAGRKVEALSLIRSTPAGESGVGTLRLTAAAMLQRQGDREAALSLLNGTDPSYVAARAQITSSKPLGGAITNAVQGLAYFYARLATDLVRDKVPYFALTTSRYARFLDPQSIFVTMAEAQALAANDEEEQALLALDAVLPSDPYATVALESRLALYQRLGRDEEALKLARSAADQFQRAADYARLGDVLANMDRNSDAAEAYARALDAKDTSDAPESWSILMLRGLALARAQDWQGAENSYRRALLLAPRQPSLLNVLGYSLLERGEKIAEATKLIVRANELRPFDIAITDSLGWAYFLSGDIDRAISTLERAVLSEPTDPTINEHLGDAYWGAGRKTDARYAWRAARLTAEEDAVARLSEKIDMGLTAKTAAR